MSYCENGVRKKTGMTRQTGHHLEINGKNHRNAVKVRILKCGRGVVVSFRVP
jgi:hypothetical protein